jgi:hypothetical protein
LEKTKTVFIKTDVNSMYMSRFKPKITDFSLWSTNHKKDTVNYMLVMANKTEWVLEAINKNYFNSSQFIWVDFAVHKMLKMDETTFANTIKAMCQKTYDNVRIAGIWDPNRPLPDEYLYNKIAWYFAGSVFGGDKQKLILFANLMRCKVTMLVMLKKHLMWEVNVWYMVYRDYSRLFDIYNCDHNASILQNY